MAFDGVTVAALVKEFNTTLKDGRIYKSHRQNQMSLCLHLKLTSLSTECFLVLTQAFL